MAKDVNTTGEGVGLPPGSKIGKYEIVERKAIGGQAIVYKCRDPLLDRFVAIKQISTHLAEDPKFLERFRKEAQIIARVGTIQPAIVTIHELIEEEKGLFIVMEYLAGHSLETTLRDNPQPVEPKATLQIIWRLAAALHDVHSAGIIHRDIKPGNIIISEGLRVKITDFGVAASTTGQTSMVLGTTKYMAPELFGGGPADGRADIYSLGMVAYEMLLGRPKFNEIFHDIVRDKHTESLRWMKWHGNEQVQAPPLHEAAPSVPQALSDIVARMMAKNPAERFQSMEELGRAIKGAFSPRARGPIAARRPEAAVVGAARIGPGDEADVLDVDLLESPATAPLPTSRLSLRTKLILAGLATAGLIAVGIVLAVQTHLRGQASVQKAREAYETALAVYEKGERDYDATTMNRALEKFQEVRKDYGGTDFSTKAGLFATLAKAYLATLDGKLEEAQVNLSSAGTEVSRLAQSAESWEKWAGQIRPYVDRLKEFLDNSGHCLKALEAAEGYLQRQSVPEARRVFDDQLARFEAKDPKVDARVKEFQHRLRAAEVLARYQEAAGAAEQAVARGDVPEAQAQYRNAAAVLESAEARILPEAQRGELQASVARQTKALELRRGYLKAMADAEKAKKDDKKPEELDALKQAQTSRDALAGVLNAEELAALERSGAVLGQQALQGRIQGLGSDILLQQGLSCIEQGDYDKAIEVLTAAKDLRASPEIDAALQKARNEKQFRGIMEAAQKAEAEGNLEEARKQYAQAQALRPEDAALAAKVQDLGYQILVAKAQKLREQKNYVEAIAALNDARQLKPENADLVDKMIADATRAQRFDDALARGKTLLEQKKYADALRHFAEAKAYIEDPLRGEKAWADAVAKLMDLTRYQEAVERGRASLAAGDYESALQSFQFAKTFMVTQEIQDLIEEAQRKKGPS